MKVKLNELYVGGIYEGELKYDGWWEENRWYIKDIQGLCFKEDAFEIVKEDTMVKTFKEVIEDIKEKEIWENENFILMLTFDKKIRITHKEGFDDCVAIYIDINSKFKLKREEYTFAEAFKAYEEGKEIESLESRYKYKQNEMFFNSTVGWHDFYDHNGIFSLKEIRGKWYINN